MHMAIVDWQVVGWGKIVCILSRFVGTLITLLQMSYWPQSFNWKIYVNAIWSAIRCSFNLFNILTKGITFSLKMCFLSKITFFTFLLLIDSLRFLQTNVLLICKVFSRGIMVSIIFKIMGMSSNN